MNRPPETRFEPRKPLSFPSDIWSLGGSIWLIIAHNSLFEGFLATEDDNNLRASRRPGACYPRNCGVSERNDSIDSPMTGSPLIESLIGRRRIGSRMTCNGLDRRKGCRRLTRRSGIPFSRCCSLCFRSDLMLVLLPSRFLSPNGWRSGLCLSTIRFGKLDHSAASVILMAPWLILPILAEVCCYNRPSYGLLQMSLG